VTTVISTLRQERDIAVGNLIGSSVYNILFIPRHDRHGARRPASSSNRR